MHARSAADARPKRSRSRLGRLPATAAALLGLVAAGCSTGPGAGDPVAAGETPETVASPAVAGPQATISASVPHRAGDVPVDEDLALSVTDGVLTSVKVRVRGDAPPLTGAISQDGSSWTADGRLEPGVRYVAVAVAEDNAGLVTRERFAFDTVDLTLDQQTFPSIAPLEGEVVGVGMPVIVQFDVPVTDRASIERHLSVDTTPRQRGSWHWLSDREVHWRPKSYWKPGTKVTVNADINSVPAGNGIYGQLSRSTSFTVGDAVVSKVDVARHRMRVFRNGELLRTIPVTAGKDGFTTRSGVKVIMEKHRHKTMDARTIGIPPGDPEYYNLHVEYAMRVTYSGEFIHGAPWSSGSQGSDNVSHGCVGMSMSDAAWLFDLSRRGDVVKVTGTDRSMEQGNGWTDWNVPFAQYREGSALS